MKRMFSYWSFRQRLKPKEEMRTVVLFRSQLRRYGMELNAATQFGAMVSAPPEVMEKTFSAMVRSVGGVYHFREQPVVPEIFVEVVDRVIADAELSKLYWEVEPPDGRPDSQFINQHFQDDNYFYGEDYAPLLHNTGADRNLMFPWDIFELHGYAPDDVSDAASSLNQGHRPRVFVVDGGIDPGSPYVEAQSQMVTEPFEVLSTRFASSGNSEQGIFAWQWDDDNPELLKDWFGHGTMVASAIWASNPFAQITMLHPSLDSVNADGNPSWATPTLSDLLIALGRMVPLIEQRTQKGESSVVSLSVGVDLTGGGAGIPMPLDQFKGACVLMDALIRDIWQAGAPVFAACGDNDKMDHLIPGQLPSVISVGGAFPVKELDTVWRKQEWAISSNSLAGVVQDWNVYGLQVSPSGSRTFPDFCGICGAETITRKEGVVAHTPALHYGVFLCHPVSRGLSEQAKQDMIAVYPTPQSLVDFFTDLGLSNPQGWADGAWSLLLAYAVYPIDNRAPSVYGDPTAQTDGWAMTPGMTSYACPTLAGALSLVALMRPQFLPGLIQLGQLEQQLRAILQQCCMDVGDKLAAHSAAPGPNEEGHDPYYYWAEDHNIDGASGFGVPIGAWVVDWIDNVFERWMSGMGGRAR